MKPAIVNVCMYAHTCSMHVLMHVVCMYKPTSLCMSMNACMYACMMHENLMKSSLRPCRLREMLGGQIVYNLIPGAHMTREQLR